MNPSIGRIVHYRLTAEDAERINRQRAPVTKPLTPDDPRHPIGNTASAGDVVPLILARVWPPLPVRDGGPDGFSVNGQAILDGNDTLWVTSAHEGSGPGQWNWPPRE